MRLAALLLLTAAPAAAQTYYVDATEGSNGAPGDSPTGAWQTLDHVNGQSFAAGAQILLQRGESWDETLAINSAGVTVSAYGTGERPLVYGIDIFSGGVVIDSVDIDHQGASGRALRVRGGHDATLRNMEIENGTDNGVDADDADGLTIESCHIHHFLAGSFAAQDDAHGITTTDTVGTTIRDTEVHHVSGDSFQSDPDRNTTISTGIIIEGCHFWTSPLAADFNAGWLAGDRPGENAIDTKVVTSDWDSVGRMTIVVRDTVAHGWQADSFIQNKAAFNMKEKIDAIFDGVTVYDNEIAFRLRGTRGNADVTLINAVVYSNDVAIRAEDDLANLRIYNSTFGRDNTEMLDHAGGSGGVGTWDVRNNAFWNAKPAEAAAASNLVADAGDFRDANSDYYDLPASGSSLVDAGETITEVTDDRAGRPRMAPYDVGAFELLGDTVDGAATSDGAAPDGGIASDGAAPDGGIASDGAAPDGGIASDGGAADGASTRDGDDSCAGDCDLPGGALTGGCTCRASGSAWSVALLLLLAACALKARSGAFLRRREAQLASRCRSHSASCARPSSSDVSGS